jgi:adenylate kinase
MVCAVVGSRLRRDVPTNGLILDGFPRTAEQAVYLDRLLADLGLPRPTAIHLHVSHDVLLRRLTARRQCAVCGAVYNLLSRPSLRGSRCENDGGALIERDDDSEGVVLRRLREFDNSSAPLIDHYRGGDYYRIDADRDPQKLADELLDIVTAEELCLTA